MPSHPYPLSRRAWLLSLWGLSRLRADEAKNISFPLQAIEGALTPPDLFFVRDHFTEPDISLSAWKLKIEGRVARPLEMTFADILESPTKKLEAVLECAGNVASGFAVSNGVWEGVPMAHLLEQVKPAPEASSVLLEGSDAGKLLRDAPELPYLQLVPLKKCLQPESLVAFRVNDRFLPRRNGFPARALLPGWYGMDSVKWLRRIVVLGPGDKPGSFHDSGLDELYNRLVKTPGGRRAVTRVSQILVKSSIAYPLDGARLPAATHVVWGFAWTGGSTIRSVEFSADGGSTWSQAKLDSAPKPLTWVRWSYRWAATPGEHALLSRATDQAGNKQPLQPDASREDGYELNWCAPLRCSVK